MIDCLVFFTNFIYLTFHTIDFQQPLKIVTKLEGFKPNLNQAVSDSTTQQRSFIISKKSAQNVNHLFTYRKLKKFKLP